jgi:ketosteroid isomerase-like protein
MCTVEPNPPGSNSDLPEVDELVRDPAVDEFFVKINHDFRRPKPSEQAVASALNTIQRLGVDARLNYTGTNESAGGGCPKCGASNSGLNRFCGYCGALLDPPERAASTSERAQNSPDGGQHVYHHHYHHHYLDGSWSGENPEVESKGVTPKTPTSPILPAPPAAGSAESALRKLVEDWAVYCNSRRLEDLVALYSRDAIVLRPNIAPARGSAAIREFLGAALGAGLGDVELNGADTGVLGEIACLTGRCRMLAPVAAGKRQEQTGKYLMVARREHGEWKILADAWSMDSAREELVQKVAPGPVRVAGK